MRLAPVPARGRPWLRGRLEVEAAEAVHERLPNAEGNAVTSDVTTQHVPVTAQHEAM
jgi:hypothetical protein